MNEDEKEELVYRLCDEFKASIGMILFTDERKYAFIAGARAALAAAAEDRQQTPETNTACDHYGIDGHCLRCGEPLPRADR